MVDRRLSKVGGLGAVVLPLLLVACADRTTPGTPGTPDTGKPIPADPIERSTKQGDAEWPQFAHSSAGLSASTARVPAAPRLLFDTTIDGMIVRTTPVVGEGKLFYRLYDGGMVALNAATGQLLWQNRDIGFSGKYGTGAYADGLVFTTTGDYTAGTDTVSALRAATGEVAWTGSTGSTMGAVKLARDAAGKRMVLFTATDGPTSSNVFAVDAASGAVRWRSPASCASDPAIEGGRVYCAGEANLVALDLETGAQVYSVPASRGSAVSSPAVADGLVVFVGDALYAHRASDGQRVWMAPFDAADMPRNGGTIVETSPAVAYGRVYVVGRSGVTAFALATGEKLWTAPAQAPGTSIAVADGRLLVAGSLLLDAVTAAVEWEAPEDKRCMSTAALTDGHFYIAPLDGSRIFGWAGQVPGEPTAY